jgi:hypothetical protein
MLVSLLACSRRAVSGKAIKRKNEITGVSFYLIRLICFSLMARMKSGSGINPTASR